MWVRPERRGCATRRTAPYLEMHCQPLDLGAVGAAARPDYFDRGAVAVIHPHRVVGYRGVGVACVTQPGLQLLQVQHHGRCVEEPVAALRSPQYRGTPQ